MSNSAVGSLLEQRPREPSPRAKGPVLSVRGLTIHFESRKGVGRAVNGVTFELWAGETLGLVGESGSGKSLTAASIVGLNPRPASAIVGGEISLGDFDLVNLPKKLWAQVRGRLISMVLQDSQAALNPVLSIGHQVAEPLRQHRGLQGQKLAERIIAMLTLLNIPAPAERIKNYPHELSGGMRQRVVSAIALSSGPQVVLADEPTTALDVTVQAAYLSRLKEIQSQTDLSILFITHDFSVVARMCDRVAVMYGGRIVETGPVRLILEEPAHPYTRALVDAIPDPRSTAERLSAIEGVPPSIYDLPKGCAFAPRCQFVEARCHDEVPPTVKKGTAHSVACWKHV